MNRDDYVVQAMELLRQCLEDRGVQPSADELVATFHRLDAAMDILGDAGMLNLQQAKLLLHCELRPGGPSPEDYARKIVRLSRAVKDFRKEEGDAASQ